MRTLSETLQQKLGEWRPCDGRETLDVAHPEHGWSASVVADHVEQLGARLWELTLRRHNAQAGVDLKARAEAVAARVTGLLEPLRLIEVDAAQGVALLRSSAPGQAAEAAAYYEALLHAGGTAQLRRYQAPHAGEPRRQQVPFALTHEALGKLVDDFTATE
jgi:hypothetical protein